MGPVTAASLMVAATGAVADPAASAAISPFWRDVTAIGVTCLVNTPRGVDTGPLHARLCEAVRTHAAAGAPVPVDVTGVGGAALAAGRVTLLVHAAVTDVRGAPVIALSVRPYRNTGDPGLFFAAAPRAVAAGDAAALDAAIRAMLAETLPWKAAGNRAGEALPRR